ncbi:MAG: right-handed parallel beta-helix repeat-containing protein [Anaerolineales bacterium]|nr:right-handed parallel beta-helix repeat-containing protein [Anaerolineales bacterium]
MRHLIFFLIALSTIVSISACAEAPVPPTPTHTPAPTQARATTANPASTPTAERALTAPPGATATRTTTPTTTPTSTITPTPTVTPTPIQTFAVNQCAEIWQPGVYKLANDIVAPGTRDCIIVQSHDVTLDCDNRTIEGNTKIVKDKQYVYAAITVRKFNFPLLESPANVEIKNCKARYHKFGVNVTSGKNVYIHDNVFSDNLNTIDHTGFGIFLGLTDGGGIRLDDVRGARIENNTTEGEAIGIDVRNSDSVVIRNNTSSKNSAWGINLLNTSNSEVSNNTTRENVRYCKWGNGTVGRGCDAAGIILQDGSSNNVVKDNQVLGDNANGIFIKAHGVRCGDNNTIQNNKIIGALYNAVELSFCKGNKIVGNEMAGSYDAVYFGFTTGTEVRDNLIRDMRNHGIITWNSRGSVIANNEIINSRMGIYMYWDEWEPKQFAFLPTSPDKYATRDNSIDNNFIHDNAVAGIRLTNAIFNKIVNNRFANNAKNIIADGKTDGNTIQGP